MSSWCLQTGSMSSRSTLTYVQAPIPLNTDHLIPMSDILCCYFPYVGICRSWDNLLKWKENEMQCAKQALVVVNSLLAQQLQPILHQWFPSKEFLSFLKLFVLIFFTETRYRLNSSPVNYVSPGFKSWPEARLKKKNKFFFVFVFACVYLEKFPRGVCKLDQKHFLLYSFQFIVISSSDVISYLFNTY